MAESNHQKPGNYLSIDGGHSGLPALYIGEETFSRLQYDIGSEDEIRPCDHCDLFMGSGPGAVDVILLGRMGLTSSEAIKAYRKLEPALSVGPTKDDEERKRNSEAFEMVFRGVLSDAGFDADTPMITTDTTKAKTVVCTASITNLTALYPIRSYRARGAPAPPCTILQAACASVASPDKFIPVTIGNDDRKVTLIDAMAGYPNPTGEMLREAQRVFGENGKVATVISIGSGKKKPLDLSAGAGQNTLVEAVQHSVLNPEITHEGLEARLHETHLYFRFNVAHDFGSRVDSSEIYHHTATYLGEADTNKRLNEAIKSIRNRSGGMTLGDLNVVTPVKITPRPRPSVVPTFVGREDILEAIRQTHFGNRQSGLDIPAISVLTGLGGSGKTQIALKFALDYEANSPEAAIYFINAESEDSLKADYESIIRSQDRSHRSDSYKDTLNWISLLRKDWCVILDNADDPELDIFSYMPKGTNGNVIITTRNATHSNISPKTSHVVEGLLMPDAISLILNMANYEVTAENQSLAQQIVHEVDHLPLALAHAGGYIYIHRCLDTYLDTYQRSKAEFLAARPRSLPHDYQLSVATTIQMSLNRLPQAARDVMVIFSHLDATSIAQSIVMRAAERQFKNIHTDLTVEPLRAETIQHADTLMSIFCPRGEWLESDFNNIIEKCLQYSLLHCSAQNKQKYHSMHRLVQTYVQVHFSSVQEHQPNQLIIRLLGSAITIGNKYEHVAFNRVVMPHLLLVKAAEVIEAPDHENFGEVLQDQGNVLLSVMHLDHCLTMRRDILGPDHPHTVQTMGNLANSYSNLGQYQQAIELNEKVLEKQREVLGLDHPGIVVTMANLAVSYSGLGQHQQAVELNKQMVEKQRETLGPDHPDTVQTMGNLANSYSNLGQYQQAIELNEKILEKQREALGSDHPTILVTMGNLAVYYSDLGQYQRAVELNKQVLEKQREILGPDHRDTVQTMGNLANSYNDLGQYQQAVELQEQVLEKEREILGPDHPETVQTMGNLGSSYSDLGQYWKAVELHDQVLEKKRAILGPDHPETVKTMGNLAISCSDLGQHQQAVELKEQVLEKRREILGPDHPDTVLSMENLANSYSDLGQHQKAIELNKQVLEKQREILGPDHPETVKTMGNLAVFYIDLGQHQQAVELNEQVLEKRRETLGPDHPHTVQTMGNLAISYSQLGRQHQAIEFREQVLEKLGEILGPDHPHTVQAMENLAIGHYNLGQTHQAIELHEQVLEKRRDILGPDHPDTMQSIGNLASSYSDLGQHQKAVELNEQVLEKRREILGPDHPDIVFTMERLATSYSDLGQHQRAVELNEQVLEKQRDILGLDHPDTVLSMGCLALSYGDLGQHQQAAKLHEQVLEKQREILGPDHPDLVSYMENLASSYRDLGQHQEAIKLEELILEMQTQ